MILMPHMMKRVHSVKGSALHKPEVIDDISVDVEAMGPMVVTLDIEYNSL